MPNGEQPFNQELYNEIRAGLNPKRKVRTRLGILHNGDVPLEMATIDPSKPRPETPDSSSSPAPAKKSTTKSASAAETAVDSKPDSSTKVGSGA